jgi:hypothetical protein
MTTHQRTACLTLSAMRMSASCARGCMLNDLSAAWRTASAVQMASCASDLELGCCCMRRIMELGSQPAVIVFEVGATTKTCAGSIISRIK